MIKTTRTKQIGAMNTSGSTSEQAMNSSFMKFSMQLTLRRGEELAASCPRAFVATVRSFTLRKKVRCWARDRKKDEAEEPSYRRGIDSLPDLYQVRSTPQSRRAGDRRFVAKGQKHFLNSTECQLIDRRRVSIAPPISGIAIERRTPPPRHQIA